MTKKVKPLINGNDKKVFFTIYLLQFNFNMKLKFKKKLG